MIRTRIAAALVGITIMVWLTGCSSAQPAPTATSTPTPAPTATPTPAPAPEYDLAKKYEGRWQGAWKNQTFGSTGSADTTAAISADGTFKITLTLGGQVFGMPAPPPITFPGTYKAGAGAKFALAHDPKFGDVTVTITPDGQVTGAFQNIPAATGSMAMKVSGTATPEKIDLRYTITSSQGWTATGTLVLDHK